MIQTIPDAIGPDQKKLINIRFLIPPKIRKRYSVVEGSVHHPEIWKIQYAQKNQIEHSRQKNDQKLSTVC